MTARIKRGATFRAQVELDEAEWAALWPWDAVTAEMRQQGARHDLQVSADPDSRIIALRADTTGWAIGAASFDVRIQRGGDVIAIPATTNIRLQIFEGAST
ncbi:hypothetical protein PE067_17260 [Paracoccus sp. DMF-8]|uniref:hypothetical protein n=1 Tax=Paracoccus sp. DMF-8 TaxID=3019445 RepID=UPI0023E45014|nr:hypothetical protein [Paracoccus sp. DMF-8]MDF3607734.1 hypothetical protein [Paracoccus sp. DMF-8]